MTSISIPKTKIERQGGVVILSVKEYQKLIKQAAPMYYLHGNEAKKLDSLVAGGLREHDRGRTKVIKSLSDLG